MHKKNTMSLDLRISVSNEKYHQEMQGRIAPLLRAWFTQELIEKATVKVNATLWMKPEENIIPKIQGLKNLGFADPVKLISAFPPILGCSLEENIRPKIHILDHFIQDISLGRELIIRAPEILSTKKDKSWIILRWLYHLWFLQKEYYEKVVQNYKRINIENIENFVIAIIETQEWNVSASDLLKKIREVKKRSIEKEEKRNFLQTSLQKGDSKKKLIERYFRGYPLKKASTQKKTYYISFFLSSSSFTKERYISDNSVRKSVWTPIFSRADFKDFFSCNLAKRYCSLLRISAVSINISFSHRLRWQIPSHSRVSSNWLERCIYMISCFCESRLKLLLSISRVSLRKNSSDFFILQESILR